MLSIHWTSGYVTEVERRYIRISKITMVNKTAFHLLAFRIPLLTQTFFEKCEIFHQLGKVTRCRTAELRAAGMQ